MSGLRILSPRASLTLHSKQLQQRLLLHRLRHASTVPPPKPRLLEKPDRFNPPSHPSRLRSKPKYSGPPLSEHERQAQQTRRYPHMMPPEGSFMHRFLTDRRIHLFISLGILITLTIGIWYEDFIHNTPYRDLLPPNSLFFAHPISFLGRWFEVYQMHVDYVSQQTAERRRQKVDDAAKRLEYRKTHGLENKTESLLGKWVGREEEPASMKPDARDDGHASAVEQAAGGAIAETYVDFQGNMRPARKKWFGIW